MKKIFKSLLFASALVLGLSSCEEKMPGFEFPGDVTLTDVVYTASNVEGNLTLFTVSLAGENGKAAFVFAGEGNELAAGTYTPAAAADAKKGNYVLGRTTVNGVDVESGDIVVSTSGIEGTVVCEGRKVHFKWSGSLPKFEGAAEVVELTVVKEAKHNLPDVSTVTLKLENAAGTNGLTIDFFSKNGLLPAGIYKANAAAEAGSFVIGDGATSWWNGAASQNITAGTVYVETADDTNYEITVRAFAGTTEVLAKFTGALELKKYEAPSTGGQLPPASYTGEDVVTPNEAGYDLHNITLKDLAGNVVASFAETLTASGAESFVGEYTVQSYPGTPGLMGNGWYFAWGDTEMGGGTQVTVDGVKYLIQSGTVTIERAENGRYTFSAQGITSTLSDQTTPGITEFLFENVSFGDEPAQGGEEFDGTVLSTVVSVTDYFAQYGAMAPIIAVQMATEGITIVEEPWEWGEYSGVNLVPKGTGTIVTLELFNDGSGVVAGTYTCSAGEQPAAGEFKKGSASGGSTWQTMADDVAGEKTPITDGTITVEVAGGNYTIILESEGLNAKYVGPLK